MANAAITNDGLALIATRQAAGQPLNLDTVQFSDADVGGATPIVVDPATSSQTSVVHSTPVLSVAQTAASSVLYTVFLDSNVGDFTVTNLGFYDADGTLVALMHVEPFEKRSTVGQQQGNHIKYALTLQHAGLADLVGVTVPAATWQQDFRGMLEATLMGTPEDFGTLGGTAEAEDWGNLAELPGNLDEDWGRLIPTSFGDIQSNLAGVHVLLQANLEAEASARIAADDAEASARIAADEAEASARAAADDAEASLRSEGDAWGRRARYDCGGLEHPGLALDFDSLGSDDGQPVDFGLIAAAVPQLSAVEINRFFSA